MASLKEQILTLIKRKASLQTEYDRWMAANPGGSWPGQLAQIGDCERQIQELQADFEKSQKMLRPR
jgi:hypothetical protein